MAIIDWILIGCGILVLAVGIPWMVIRDKKKRQEQANQKQAENKEDEEDE